MKRGVDDAHLDAALNPALLEGEGASELNNTLLQEGGRGEAWEADAAAAAAPLAATPLADVDVARRVVGRWRAFVAERKGVLLLRLLVLPDLFEHEVLKRLDPTARRWGGRGWRRCSPRGSRACQRE